jgi:S-adenosyl-L-methionine hydrolase (adenosine-forming)
MGGEMLAEAWPYLPTGVHLALVDPFTATNNRGVAVLCRDGSVVVAPDNGLAFRAWQVAGGVAEAYELAEPRLWADSPSRSFRGRDVFAPVTAHLASGVPLAEVGPRLDPDSLVMGRISEPKVHGDHVHGEIRMVDHFGNLALNMRRSDLEAAGIQLGDLIELRCGGRTSEVPFTLSFGEVPGGRTVVCEDSFRAITIAVNGGRADRTLRAASGEAVVLGRVHRHLGQAATKVSVVDGPPS